MGLQIVIGYVTPMLVLYNQEVKERHQFASGRGLDVADLRTCFWASAPAVLRDVAVTVLTGVTILGGL